MPGSGNITISRSNGAGGLQPYFNSQGQGLAAYDLRSSLDRAIALDYNGDGRQDLFFYRPGQGAAWVARSNGNGTFTAVYAVGDDGAAGLNGIAGYDFLSRSDQALAIDYNGDGKQDLFFYRPGRGAAWVARSNGDGSFTPVYAVGDDGAAGLNGIAGYDFLSGLDRAVAFDYNGDRKQDLFFYRPGQGAAWVARSNGDGSFTAVYAVGDDGPAGLNGIADYNFLSRADQALAFDYNGDGNKDLIFYRPGRGAAWVARSNGDGSFTAVYAVGDDGAAGLNGIGGFDLLSANDRAIALDYDGDGFEDLVFQPVGSDQAWVVRSNGNGTLASFTNAPGTLSGVVAASGGTADVLIGDNGNNVLRGANGNDTFIGSAGNDVLNGGSGTDTANYSPLKTVVRLGAFGVLSKGAQGTDTLINIETIVGSSLQGDTVDHSGASSFPASGTVTNLSTGDVTVNGSAPLPLSFKVSQFENVVGSALADTIIGNSDNNILNGGRGNDVLTGGAGRDRFRFLNMADGIDIIKDFTTPTSFLTPNSGDLIEVSQAGFGAVGLSQFTYSSFTGSLSFLGSQLAILENKPVEFNILRDVVFI